MIAKIYAELIRKGLKTIDDIPLEKDRIAVAEILGIDLDANEGTEEETPAAE